MRLPIALILILGFAGVGHCQTSRDDSVAGLIQQLGADSYSARERAKNKLRQLGLEAFDELQIAQNSDEVEIAASARYLISSLLVSWSKESDPPEVRDTLFEYGAQSDDERLSRIQRLAEFPERRGLAALARLSRFDRHPPLNRAAALELMKQPMSEEESVRNRHATTILEIVGDSDRQWIQWLKAYANDLEKGDYDADSWQTLVRKQRKELDGVENQLTSRASVLDLIRVCARRATWHGQRDQALDLAVANIDLIPPTTRDLIDACSWAVDHQLHEFVIALQDEHKTLFGKHASLIYAVAEARKVAGENELADKLAQQALALRPFPKSEKDKAATPPSAMDEIADAHREIGQQLEDRGLFDWAEGEYRLILDNTELYSLTSVSTRQHMIRMLGDLNRHQAVVDIVAPMLDRADKDMSFKDRLRASGYQLDYFRSESDFHRAQLLAKSDQLEQARPLMLKAYNLNQRNVDILIQMYRTPGDDDWTAIVNRHLSQAVRESESEIRSAELRVQNPIQGFDSNRSLALRLNQYAWLVSNTEGDKQRALRESLRSLKLDPDNAAQLDTAARCYLTLGKFAEAKKMQEKALRLQPHSPPLMRQLKQIEKAAMDEKANQSEISN